MEGIIAVINIVLVGMIAFHVVGAFVGDKPMGRLIKVITAPIASILYIPLMAWANYDAPFWLGIIIFLGPIGSMIILGILGYVLNGNSGKSA